MVSLDFPGAEALRNIQEMKELKISDAGYHAPFR
jgi:hypothetical protein